MLGLRWAAIAWGVGLVVYVMWRGAREVGAGLRGPGGRERIAVVLALLGTHTLAGRSSADEILANPLVIERAIRGTLSGLALLVVLPALMRRAGALQTRNYPGMLALLIYVGVGGISTIYSVAPLVTIAKVFELGVGVAIVLAATLSSDGDRRLKDLVRFVVFLEGTLVGVAVAGFLLGMDTFSDLGPRPGFVSPLTMNSPYLHSNALSAAGGLLAAFALGSFFESSRPVERARWMGLFGLGTVGTILASGRQGVVIWVAGVAVLLWVHRRWLLAALLGPAAVGLVVANWETLWQVLTRARPANVATLSGRLVYWSSALDVWAEHPWSGFGFGAGGRFVALSAIDQGNVSSLHSGYMEALVGVGLVGCLPLAYAIWRAGKWSYRQLRRRDLNTRFAVVIVPLLLHTSV
ncbi:MAG: O-antigen ligase family protein, partial [Acidimicrobiia bacterium]